MSGDIHYAQYLHLETLLSAQHPVTGDPDELHFIVVHQVHELWFKLALHHLERVRSSIVVDDLTEAVRLLDQVNGIFENLSVSVAHLKSLSPLAFHRFRQSLAPGSGLQSYQFREIEFLCGLRDERHVQHVHRALATEQHWAAAHRRLSEPSLLDALNDLLARRNVTDLSDVYGDPGGRPDVFALCEALSVLDQGVTLWRYHHIQLVERTIGAAAMGTGGTTHDYLQATLRIRLFPALWAARDTLTRRVDRMRES